MLEAAHLVCGTISTHTMSPPVQVYNLFVEIGRVAFINYGPDAGKLVVIVDVVDQKRVCLASCTH